MNTDGLGSPENSEFSEVDRLELIQRMFADKEIGLREEQLRLLDQMLAAWQGGHRGAWLPIATDFQIEKERRRKNNPTLKVAPELIATYKDSAKKLLQDLPETLKRFYTGDLGRTFKWLVVFEQQSTPGGRKQWVLTVTANANANATTSENSQPEVVEDKESSLSGQRQTLLGPFSSVPPKLHYIDRPEIFDPLVAELCSGENGAFGLTAVEGMGGVGKTTLAVAACHDERVRAVFTDGIIWVPCGPVSDDEIRKKRIEFACRQLNVRFDGYTPPALGTALANKSVLVVLDDVWEDKDVDPFLVTSARSRLLFTTRNKGLALGLGIENSQDVGTLDEGTARSFLEYWSHRRDLPESWSQILHECAGLALAISMVGAALHKKDDTEWQKVLEHLRQARLKYVGRKIHEYQYVTIHAAIQIGVEALREDKDYYMRLAVLLEGMAAPTAILRALWGGEEHEIDRRADILVDRSLARRLPEGIVLHDLQLDYLRDEHPHAETLALQRAALRRSAHIVKVAPAQFAPQMTGRLLPHKGQLGMGRFLEDLRSFSPLPRLRPLLPALTAPGQASQIVLEDPTWITVSAISLSADGTKAVFCANLGLIFWDKETNKFTCAPIELDWWCRVKLTGDGSQAFFCAFYETSLWLWDIATGTTLRLLDKVDKVALAFALSSNGKRAVCGCEDGTFVIWDLNADTVERRLRKLDMDSHSLGLSGDGKWAVAGTKGGLSILEIDGTGEPLWLNVPGTASHVAINHDGTRVVFAHGPEVFSCCTLSVWDLNSRGGSRIVYEDLLRIERLSLSSDGKRAVLLGARGRIIVCDLDRGDTPREHRGPEQHSAELAISADGKWGVTCGLTRASVTHWDLDAPGSATVIEDCQGVIANTDCSRAVVLRADGGLVVVDLGEEPQVRYLAAPQDIKGWLKKHNFALSGDGRRAITGAYGDGRVWLWDIDNGRPLKSLEMPSGFPYVEFLSVDHHGKRGLVKWDGGQLVVWDLEEGGQCRSLEGTEGVTSAAISPDGGSAVTGWHEGTVMAWDLDAGMPSATIGKHKSDVTHLEVAPHQNFYVSCSKDGEVILWEFLNGRVTPYPIGINGSDDFLLGANGRWMFGESVDTKPSASIKSLCDLASRRRREVHFPEDRGLGAHAALHEDGSLLVSAIQRDTLCVFDLTIEKEVLAYTADANWAWCRWVGDYILAGDELGQLHILAYQGPPKPYYDARYQPYIEAWRWHHYGR
ncbi:MAG TPA: NB-ARC domain-containing protein [Bryobacteraceae bacterium]|jgi:WD40 repeat protein|nr:NB-ARC domain-containing protein [Bryobacteraceae bacterium]